MTKCNMHMKNVKTAGIDIRLLELLNLLSVSNVTCTEPE